MVAAGRFGRAAKRLRSPLHSMPTGGRHWKQPDMPSFDQRHIFDSPYQQWVFSPHSEARSRILAALAAASNNGDPFNPTDDQTRAGKLASKLADCCRNAAIVTDDATGEVIAHEMRCKSRLCPRCSRIRARAIIPRVCHYITFMDSPRLVTLTIKSNNEPLRDQCQRLTTCFKKLRRHDLWKSRVTSGCYVLEITYNHATGQWHPHLHCVIDGTYIPQAGLAAAWHQITGDSRIVDIRLVRSRMEAARYVAGYVAKSSNVEQMPDNKLFEWADQLHGLRSIQTFGGLHGVKIEQDDDEDKPAWKHGTFAATLTTTAAQGDADAARILTYIADENSRLPTTATARSRQRVDAGIPVPAELLRSWQARHERASNHETGPDTADQTRSGDRRERSLWQWEDVPTADLDRGPPHASNVGHHRRQ